MVLKLETINRSKSDILKHNEQNALNVKFSCILLSLEVLVTENFVSFKSLFILFGSFSIGYITIDTLNTIGSG